MKVYLLTHYRNEEDLNGFKTIGVFSSEAAAARAIDTLKTKPGFKDYPQNFNVGGYEVDKVFWGDGFGG
jgi:homoserine kinase type II